MFSTRAAAVIFSFMLLCGEAAIITVPPVPTIGCYGGSSTFYCESNRDDIINIFWSVNGGSLTDETASTRGITVASIITITAATTTLTITGLPVNNGVDIGCNFVTDEFDFDAQAATFTVTDIPPVENVTIGFDDTLVNITWSPPSCIPVDHLYTVSITNDTATVNDNTTELYYTISVSPCSSNYTVTVTVIDVGFTQYQSMPTSEYEEKNNTQEITPIIDPDSLLVSFNGVESSFLTIYYKINPVPYLVCPSTIVRATVNIQSVLPGPDYYNNNIVIDNLIESFDNSLSTGSYTIGPINERFIGQLNIESSTEIGFSTYNVQSVSIDPLLNGTTNITCYFAQNSSATGCNMKFILLQSINEIFFNITKSASKNFATEYMNIPVGEYEVSVHDIVNEDIDDNPSFNMSMYIVPAQVITIIPSSTINYNMSTVQISMSVSSNSIVLGISNEVLNTTTVNTAGNVVILSVSIIGIIIILLSIIIIIITVASVLYCINSKKRRTQAAVMIAQNPAYEKVNTERIQRNPAYEKVDMGRIQRNPAYEKVNMGRIQRNPAYEKVDMGRIQNNPAYEKVNMGRIQRNPVYDNVVIVN